MLRIRITSLKRGVHHFDLAPTPAELDLDPDRFADIHVEAELDYEEDRILVSLQAEARATLECDRSLQLFDQQVAGSYRLLFAAPEVVEADGVEEGFEGVRVLRPSDQEIDVTAAVRDTLLLAIPARCVAPGAEDLEIPTRFGAPEAGEDIDPRWEALRKLRARGEDT